MSIVESLFLHIFSRPKGMLGRFGGTIMARMNKEFTYSVIDLLDIQPNDQVLEIGFVSGVGIQHLAGLVSTGYIAGIDYSKEMVEQADATQYLFCLANRSIYFGLPPQDENFSTTFPDS